MNDEELTNRLLELGELKEQSGGKMTREELLNSLKNWERTLHVTIWSDHSSIMNHGHSPDSECHI